MDFNKILITGGAGYIGSCLIQKALDQNYFVNVLDSSELIINDPRVSFFRGSIEDKNLLQTSLVGVDIVYHLAGVSDGRQGKLNPELTKKINSDSIDLILELAKHAGVRKFFFASTFGVYGNQYDIPLTEDLSPNPIDPYSISKAICEERIFAINSDVFNTYIFRIAMVYGVGPKIRLDFLVNNLCEQAIKNGKLNIIGGDQQRPQVNVNDVCDLFLRIIKEDKNLDGQVFNVIESNPSIKEISDIIKKILPNTILHFEPLVQNQDSFVMNGLKLQKLIDFEYTTNLEAGITDLINYFRNYNYTIHELEEKRTNLRS
jgi:nucleoside-diphosphate-sugar epimerase